MKLEKQRVEAVIKIAIQTGLLDSRLLAKFLHDTTSLSEREAKVYSVEAIKLIKSRRLNYVQEVH